jgi:hypothetical protein
VVNADRLNPEPRAVQRSQQREQHMVGEIRVVAELVDAVVARAAPARKCQQVSQFTVPLRLDLIVLLVDGGGGRWSRWQPATRRCASRAVQRDHPSLRHPRH